MKNLKFMIIALMAIIGFCSCEKQNKGNNYDHSKDLVGTWTCLQPNYAETLVISADGSIVSTGVENGEYWENIAGNVVMKNGDVTMIFEDDDNFEGEFVIIVGEAFSIYKNDGKRYTYHYCANDLADEIIGMWVCNTTPNGKYSNMTIISYKEDGTSIFTGAKPNSYNKHAVTLNASYKVVGDLLFQQDAFASSTSYIASRLIYSPNGTTLGDIMTYRTTLVTPENNTVETTSSYIRIKESLNLANKKYDYSKIFISNVKGLDKDIEFMGYTVNFAKMDGSMLDKMFKSLLFNIEFPTTDSIHYIYHYNNSKEIFNAPITVEGNKLTVKMSAKVPTLKDVEFYAFQDTDDCQLHLYMHKKAFVNFYTNMQAMLMAGLEEQFGKPFDITNADEVDVIYNYINDAVETINLSLVMEAPMSALIAKTQKNNIE